VLYSHRIGRSTYREKYGFFFRTDAVEYVGEAVVYIDERDVFAREPFSARFRSRHTGEPFIAATLHVVYGDSRADRVPELHYLARYWDWLHEVHGDAPRILMGDFNVNPGFHAWEPLRAAGGRKLLQSGATTLSPQDGRYVNLYDNIIVSQNTPLPIRDAAILPFPSLLEVTHEQARARISDHAPVYVLVGDAALAFDGLTASAFAFTDTAPCIDLNHADERQLQSLPHIGPARARAIIAHREHRPFQRVSGLTRVPGLGPARVEDIRATGQLCALP